MSPSEHRLCEPDGLGPLLADLARRVAAGWHVGAPLCLVGVRTRGVPIARRLAERLRGDLDQEVPVGAVDITMYRDDLGRGDHWPVLHGTEIDFDVDGAEVVLVDDVLYTGRTIRAAMNAVCDLGRPARVRLAVVVDRGHRELPIQADYVGLTVPTARGERVLVRIRPVDPVEEIVRVDAEGKAPP